MSEGPLLTWSEAPRHANALHRNPLQGILLPEMDLRVNGCVEMVNSDRKECDG